MPGKQHPIFKVSSSKVSPSEDGGTAGDKHLFMFASNAHPAHEGVVDFLVGGDVQQTRIDTGHRVTFLAMITSIGANQASIQGNLVLAAKPEHDDLKILAHALIQLAALQPERAPLEVVVPISEGTQSCVDGRPLPVQPVADVS